MNTQDTIDVKHNGHTYTLSAEKPKTGDKVLTDNYGVWTFHEGSAPVPFWCNEKTCMKIVSTTDPEIELSCEKVDVVAAMAKIDHADKNGWFDDYPGMKDKMLNAVANSINA